MGWTFFSEARTAADIKQQIRHEVVASMGAIDAGGSGNEHYVLVTNKDGSRSIVQFLLAKSEGCWGYKDIPEEAGPCARNCPLRLLEQATAPRNAYAAQWRQRVRQHAARKSEHARLIRSLRVGDRIRLVEGCGSLELRIVALKPTLVGATPGGQLYRLRPSVIAERVAHAEPA